jgi:hypothetical protein
VSAGSLDVCPAPLGLENAVIIGRLVAHWLDITHGNRAQLLLIPKDNGGTSLTIM